MCSGSERDGFWVPHGEPKPDRYAEPQSVTLGFGVGLRSGSQQRIPNALPESLIDRERKRLGLGERQPPGLTLPLSKPI